MVGRNKMLNEEAISEMKGAGRAVNRVQPRVVRQRAPTEEELMDAALKESQMQYKADQQRQATQV